MLHRYGYEVVRLAKPILHCLRPTDRYYSYEVGGRRDGIIRTARITRSRGVRGENYQVGRGSEKLKGDVDKSNRARSTRSRDNGNVEKKNLRLIRIFFQRSNERCNLRTRL